MILAALFGWHPDPRSGLWTPLIFDIPVKERLDFNDPSSDPQAHRPHPSCRGVVPLAISKNTREIDLENLRDFERDLKGR